MPIGMGVRISSTSNVSRKASNAPSSKLIIICVILIINKVADTKSSVSPGFALNDGPFATKFLVSRNKLLLLKTGSLLFIVGYNALLSNNGGGANVAIGFDAGEFCTDGGYNTFIGYKSGQGITGTKMQGDQNTCVGYYSGVLLQGTDADFNTLILELNDEDAI